MKLDFERLDDRGNKVNWKDGNAECRVERLKMSKLFFLSFLNTNIERKLSIRTHKETGPTLEAQRC